ncbi:MAG: DUF3570 domain-containing protein [Reinekea forsetii]|nr:DUF3570 domain-containing protein [Reinekea forsetii]
MQLKSSQLKLSMLALASGSLLSAVGASAAEGTDWQAEAAVLYYGELDRVTALEPVINLKRIWSPEQIASATLVLDTLGGASHNGAAVVDSPQTFAGSSGSYAASSDEGDDDDDDDDDGGGEQTFAAGEVPLISGFEDFRMALDLAYTQPLNTPLNTISVGTALSKEEDYLSIGVNGGLAAELFSRNTKVSVSGAAAYDRIAPEDGIPQILGDSLTAASTLNSADKWVGEYTLGLTQVINKISIVQLNYNSGKSSGYHTDPYKIISRLDSAGVPVDYLNESRPEQRAKQSLYSALKVALGTHSLTASYRYYWDDWGVVAKTSDALLRFNLSERLYLEGHGRWHQQTKADFYQLWLAEAEVPDYASADHRLGDLQTQTLGLNMGYQFSDNQAVTFRTEWYHQSDQVTGNKAAQMDAVISQLGFKMVF